MPTKMKDAPKGRKFRNAPPPPEIFKFREKGQTIEGTFEGFIESDAKDGETIRNAVLVEDGGNRWQIALNTTLSYYFQKVQPGNYVRVIYKGKRGFEHPKLGMVQKNHYDFSWADA